MRGDPIGCYHIGGCPEAGYGIYRDPVVDTQAALVNACWDTTPQTSRSILVFESAPRQYESVSFHSMTPELPGSHIWAPAGSESPLDYLELGAACLLVS